MRQYSAFCPLEAFLLFRGSVWTGFILEVWTWRVSHFYVLPLLCLSSSVFVHQWWPLLVVLLSGKDPGDWGIVRGSGVRWFPGRPWSRCHHHGAVHPVEGLRPGHGQPCWRPHGGARCKVPPQICPCKGECEMNVLNHFYSCSRIECGHLELHYVLNPLSGTHWTVQSCMSHSSGGSLLDQGLKSFFCNLTILRKIGNFKQFIGNKAIGLLTTLICALLYSIRFIFVPSCIINLIFQLDIWQKHKMAFLHLCVSGGRAGSRHSWQAEGDSQVHRDRWDHRGRVQHCMYWAVHSSLNSQSFKGARQKLTLWGVSDQSYITKHQFLMIWGNPEHHYLSQCHCVTLYCSFS